MGVVAGWTQGVRVAMATAVMKKEPETAVRQLLLVGVVARASVEVVRVVELVVVWAVIFARVERELMAAEMMLLVTEKPSAAPGKALLVAVRAMIKGGQIVRAVVMVV